MTHRPLNGGTLMKITLALGLVSLHIAGTTHGILAAVLATFGFIAITAFLIAVLLRLLTRD
jgi:hypothetical protein